MTALVEIPSTFYMLQGCNACREVCLKKPRKFRDHALKNLSKLPCILETFVTILCIFVTFFVHLKISEVFHCASKKPCNILYLWKKVQCSMG